MNPNVISISKMYLIILINGISQTTFTQPQWNPLCPGLNSAVHAIVPHGTDIYVGGAFTDAGGHADADYLARWDGCEWHPVASALSGIVSSIVISGDSINMRTAQANSSSGL